MLGRPRTPELMSLAIVYVIGQGVRSYLATLKFGGAGAAETIQARGATFNDTLIYLRYLCHQQYSWQVDSLAFKDGARHRRRLKSAFNTIGATTYEYVHTLPTLGKLTTRPSRVAPDIAGSARSTR